MKVRIQPRPTTIGTKMTMRSDTNSKNGLWCPTYPMARNMVTTMIIWIVMVMTPMMPLASETLRVAERLRSHVPTGSFQANTGTGASPIGG